jgi:transcriptional regulator with XRE-family HTH domain
MAVEEHWSAYVRRVVGADMNQLDIAARTGLAQTNIGRWLRGAPGQPRADSVIAFARAFNQPPLEALIAAAYLTAEEANATVILRPGLVDYSSAELLAELSSRFSD